GTGSRHGQCRSTQTKPTGNPANQWVVVALTLANLPAVGVVVVFPLQQVFSSSAEYETDPHFTATLPPAGVAQCGIATPADKPFERGQALVSGRVIVRWTGNFTDLAGDLTRVIGHIKAAHEADAGTASKQLAGHRV